MEYNTKKIEIFVPQEFDEKTCQECFNLGMRVFTGVYGGGAFVAYMTEESKDKGMLNTLFQDYSCAAIIEMCNHLRRIENNSANLEEKVKEINKSGNEVLEKIEENR